VEDRKNTLHFEPPDILWVEFRGIVLAAQLTEQADEHALEKIHFVYTKDEAHELIVQLRARQGDALAK
jgi:hypothetical protein